MKLFKVLTLVGFLVAVDDGMASNANKSVTSTNKTNQTSQTQVPTYEPTPENIQTCMNINGTYNPTEQNCKNFLMCTNTGQNYKNKENDCRVKHLKNKESLEKKI